MFTATLVAAGRLSAGDISSATDRMAALGCAPTDRAWIEDGKACDIHFAHDPAGARQTLEALDQPIDVIVQRTTERRRRLIIADMDSTMITVECIDELADYAGIKPQIAEVTERAMRGELDFEAALTSRVALLKGLPESAIARCLAERVTIMPGARALVQTVRAAGGYAVLVSGGFTRFAEPVGAQIGFDRVIANVLGIANGALDGTVARPIIGSHSKLDALNSAVAERGLVTRDVIAVGDGANDIAMIEAAGLGVAYHAKPATRAASSAAIVHGDLSVILYAIGITRRDWAVDPVASRFNA